MRPSKSDVVDLAAERRKRARRRLRPKPALFFTLFLILIAGFLLYTILNRDSLTDNPVSKLVESLSFSFGNGETATVFNYDQDIKNNVQVFKNGLAVLSQKRLSVYDGSGEEQVGEAISFQNPVLRVNGNHLLIFDRNGIHLYGYKGYEKRIVTENLGGILNAKLNSDGRYVVLAREAGYTGVATVYGADDTALYKWKSADQLVTDVALSANAEQLVAATVKQDGVNTVGEIRIYSTRDDSGQPTHSFTQLDGLPLAVDYKSKSIIASLWEHEMVLLNTDCEEIARYSWEGKILRSYCLTGDGIVLQVSQYETEGGSTVIVLNNEGKVLAEQDFSVDIIGISAESDKLALLTHDACAVYTKALEQLGSVQVPNDARSVIVLQDGSVFLLGRDGATLMNLN